MKIAVFGKSGQLSKALHRQFNDENHVAIFYDRTDCDFASDPSIIAGFATKMDQVDVVIIAAAYTGVVEAEDHVDMAFAINAEAPKIIAEICKIRAIPLIYISSDYVFDGTERNPYNPDHPPNPLNVYGRSKRAGEIGVLDSGCEAAILRTSWLFGGTGRNFFTTMLNLKKTKPRIKVIDDQVGRPTFVGHLAGAISIAALKLSSGKSSYSGIFHVTNTGTVVSWAGFAQAIFDAAENEKPVIVDKILTQEYKGMVSRPLYSILDNSKFERIYDFCMPDWTDGMNVAFKEWSSIK